jgi:hypothetical protein
MVAQNIYGAGCCCLYFYHRLNLASRRISPSGEASTSISATTVTLSSAAENVALDISGVKAAVMSQVEELRTEIAQLDQRVSTFSIPKEFQGKLLLKPDSA